MNNMSLVKVTVGIVVAAAATFIVNANEVLPALGEIKNEVKKELPTGKVSAIEDKTFTQLLSQYDADKDGSLSETELLSSDNEALKIAFKKLDANNDLAISKYEFTAFTGKVIK
jgi:Ca2+-binding EF-hand superfamily protein